ncbi:hypothetical protein PIROE2DRAFT_5092, partial [Piromyces sp. E2]
NADWNSSIGKVLIYNTVNIILSIQVLSEGDRSIDGLLESFEEYESDIYELLLSLLILLCSKSESSANTMPSTPLSIIQSVIAKACSYIPEEILFEQTCFNELCSVLNSNNSDVQIITCNLLLRITKNMIQSQSLKVETKGLDGNEAIPDSLISIASKTPKTYDSEFKFIDNDVDSHKILGYLLSYVIILEHFNDATFELKSVYTTQFRQQNNLLNNFMLLICNVLNIGKNDQVFDISNWNVDEFDIETFEPNDISICVLSAHLYWKALKSISSLVRNWWNELKNRQLSIAIEQYTKKYITPLLVANEMNSVINTDRSQYENLVIKANKSRNEIIAQYVIPSEESCIDIIIRIPQDYPLKQVHIDGGQRAGVQESRWRSWILSSSAVMVAQNGNIMDSVLVFYNNVKLHFEGVEECTIW